jgi:membrane protease YdiL (CAAX protease family)
VSTLVPFIFLLIIGSLLFTAPQARLAAWLRQDRRRIWLAPALLSGLFCAALLAETALNPPLLLLILAYTLGATLLAPQRMDAAVILVLWLPVELSLTRYWTSPPLQGFANTLIYGTGITLALVLLLLFRGIGGMKYRLPSTARDLLYPVAGFLLVAPVLIGLGQLLGFIAPFHVPENLSAAVLAGMFLRILAYVAFPEEILFRSLIQNLLMQKFGSGNWTLALAAVIFGAAHLNNGPGPLPNWRYMLLATIAGFAYGKVFQKSSTVLSSAILHALVNTARHMFF